VLADKSNGYQAVAEEFISRRTHSTVGVVSVGEWAKLLPHRSSVLDLGCGNGVPISQALMDPGLLVYGVDASPSLIAAFRARFPDAPAECIAVEDSQFFGRTFDGVIAWGLMFLLAPDAQAHLIKKVSRALKNGGSFLFTSPWHVCQWSDNLTAHTSISLGSEEYRRILTAEGLILIGEGDDEGENHYYFVAKP
jgi:SAM-dependent methyltransferase